MRLLHFDTESRRAVVQMTRTELQDLDSRFLASPKPWVTEVIHDKKAGTVEILVVGDR